MKDEKPRFRSTLPLFKDLKLKRREWKAYGKVGPFIRATQPVRR
jgi:hypothetical protein